MTKAPLLAAVTASMALFSAEPASGASACDGFLNNLVAIGLAGRHVVIAVASSDGDWRTRFVDVGAGASDPRISTDGTALRVTVAEKTQFIDLTRRDSPKPKVQRLDLEQLVYAEGADSIEALAEDHAQAPCPVARVTRAVNSLSNDAAHGATDVGPTAPSTWRFSHLQLDIGAIELYAPILEFADQEVLLPSPFEVWNELNGNGPFPKSASARISETVGRYAVLAEHDCTIYYLVSSLKGSWLIEFWFYYPADAGAFGDHLHDSEHLFVEVDKLGGVPYQVVGAGHGNWATNNIYRTTEKHAFPISLPLHAIVELRKHATAPDINGDGVFTPGIDSNSYLDVAKVWGIRDTLGPTDSNLRSFSSIMMLSRLRARFRGPQHLARHFAGVDDIQCDCRLLDLAGEVARASSLAIRRACKTSVTSAECGINEVVNHVDRREPASILKASAFPPVFVRFGVAYLPGSTNWDSDAVAELISTMFFGIGADVATLTRGRLPIPGRLALDVYGRQRLLYTWDPYQDFVTDITDKGFGFAGVSARYERPITNLLGAYVGLTWFSDLRGPGDSGIQSAWLAGGLLGEVSLPVPLLGRVPFTGALGLTFSNNFGLAFDLRAGVSVPLRFKRSGFGIRN